MADYRVPNFSDVEVAFGAPATAYLTREQMGDEFYGDGNVFTRHANGLFFKGGSVLPDGRQWKAGINAKKAGRAVAALLRSFEPKHEIKVGTVGYALSQWTEAKGISIPANAKLDGYGAEGGVNQASIKEPRP
ncbi:hypothetical protein [Brevundimonas sp.]|uniref:hypothetical protein n=1 Tax=Brevundimonas sp. TaxID=1871086 RepID=UPI0028A119A1|nr:hypothetical protein [Brevundimonas sp.]